MIIRIIATALIQCTVRTHAGWMTFVVAGTVRSSLAARLDMVVPSLENRLLRTIRRELRLRYCHRDAGIDTLRPLRSQNSEPGCPGSPLASPVGDRFRIACQDAGISTVSTTWITPFD